MRREGIDLPPFLLRVLSIVGRFPDHNQQQLLQRRGHDKGQVARAFKQLEQQGLIYRSGSSTPRRITQVTLTEEGQRLFCRLEAARSELASQALSGFAPRKSGSSTPCWSACWRTWITPPTERTRSGDRCTARNDSPAQVDIVNLCR
ncbi:transcriptional regulator SlyA [Halomonas elongata]|uniref:Transcriptional regulator SlyA n=1 Tax=Halomonas elongata TaxID=2746 RepID=A0A1B8NZ99_HALEL|nr:transcriptional regulator SlyA [Halomonas elongata]